MLVADFCMEPSSNALGLVEDRYYGIAAFYSTCEGPNPITAPIVDAAVSLKLLNASIAMLSAPGGSCEENSYLLACSTSIQYAYTNLTAVEESADCEPVEKQWKEVFNDAICRSGYAGMHITWTTQCVVCALVLVVLVGASLTYPYFTTNWKTGITHIFYFTVLVFVMLCCAVLCCACCQWIATHAGKRPTSYKSLNNRDKHLSTRSTNSSRTTNTAGTDDSPAAGMKALSSHRPHTHQPLNDQDFLFIDNDDRLSGALSFGLDADSDNDPTQALLRSEDSDDLSENTQRLRFNSGFKGGASGGGVTHVKPPQGKNFSQYLI